MAKQKKTPSEKPFLFGKKNYVIMLIGMVIIALGFILMSGGGSNDPNIFNPDIYSFRRIRLAPTLVIIGLAVEVYAILAKSKK